MRVHPTGPAEGNRPTPFAQGLRLARKAAGLRPDELAALAELPVELVHAAELGVILPDALSLARIAYVLSRPGLERSRS
jgi:hypothetical protein